MIQKFEYRYNNGPVSEKKFKEALDFIANLEEEHDRLSDYEEYTKPFLNFISMAENAIKCFIQQRQPLTLSEMQTIFYQHLEAYKNRPIAYSAIYSTVNSKWHEIGEWQR